MTTTIKELIEIQPLEVLNAYQADRIIRKLLNEFNPDIADEISSIDWENTEVADNIRVEKILSLTNQDYTQDLHRISYQNQCLGFVNSYTDYDDKSLYSEAKPIVRITNRKLVEAMVLEISSLKKHEENVRLEWTPEELAGSLVDFGSFVTVSLSQQTVIPQKIVRNFSVGKRNTNAVLMNVDDKNWVIVESDGENDPILTKFSDKEDALKHLYQYICAEVESMMKEQKSEFIYLMDKSSKSTLSFFINEDGPDLDFNGEFISARLNDENIKPSVRFLQAAEEKLGISLDHELSTQNNKGFK